jgi:phage terminase large subunit-like protein
MVDVSRTDILNAKDDVIEALSDRESIRLSFEAERELAMRDTYYLCKYVLGYGKLNDKFHLKLAKFFDRHIYSMQMHLHPRGHYKTTLLTVSGSIRLVLMDPNMTILIRTNREENARKFVGDEIRQHFINNPKFRALFPEHATQKASEEGTATAFITPARTKKWIRSPTFEGASITQRLTSNHYLLVVFDDIVDEKNSETPELRQKGRNAYTQTLSLCDGTTPEGLPWHWVVGTRWHLDDLYNHLLEQNKRKKTFRPYITSAYYKVADKDTGNEITKILFPEEFTWEKLMYIKEDYDRQGSNLFSCLYLNDPVPSEDMALDPAYLRFYDDQEADFQKKPLTTMILVDPSPAEKQNEGDPNALTAVSMDEEGAYYIREIRRGWWRLHEVVEQILDMYRIYHPFQVGIEAVCFQKWLGQELEREKLLKKCYFETLEIKRDPRQRKWERQKKLLFPLRAGKIHIKPDEPCFGALKAEMMGYPKGRHDDILDTLTDAVELLTLPSPKKTGLGAIGYRLPPIVLRGTNNFQTGYTYRRSYNL